MSNDKTYLKTIVRDLVKRKGRDEALRLLRREGVSESLATRLVAPNTRYEHKPIATIKVAIERACFGKRAS